MPEESNPADKVRVQSMTVKIVPVVDEVAAGIIIDQNIGVIGSLLKQGIAKGDLVSAVLIISTSRGMVSAAIYDKKLPPDSGIDQIIAAQADKMSVSNIATSVATTLAIDACQDTRILKTDG